MGHKKLTGILSLLSKKELPLETIAANYGFNKSQVIEMLDKEFKRIHNGVDVANYRIKYIFEWAKANKDYKGVSDNRIKLELLLAFEALINKKPLPTMKQIKDHVAAINKKQMPFENRVKVITSRINRVNNRDYKVWLKTALYQLPKK
jgi:hypothetical protein